MNIFLSCGPILEPLIGITCATISCIAILIFPVIKFLKSKKYTAIKAQSVTDQWIDFVPIIVVTCIVVFFLWWIMMFLFTGIAFEALK